MLKLGIFSSGGEGSRFLLEQTILKKPNDISIEWVFMNKSINEDEYSSEFAAMADFYGIQLHTKSWKNFKENYTGKEDARRAYDFGIFDSLEESWSKVDYIFLVGYMRIIKSQYLLKYPLINLHPGLPGGHKGTYKEVIEKLKAESKDGMITTGSMTHHVVKELDGGKPIMYFQFTCAANYDLIRKNTLEREQYLLIETMKYLNTPKDISFNINHELLSDQAWIVSNIF